MFALLRFDMGNLFLDRCNNRRKGNKAEKKNHNGVQNMIFHVSGYSRCVRVRRCEQVKFEKTERHE